MLKHKELQIDDMIMCLNAAITGDGCFNQGSSYRITKITKATPLNTARVTTNTPVRVATLRLRAMADGLPMPPLAPVEAKPKKEKKDSISTVNVLCEAGCEHIIDYHSLKQYFRVPQIAIRNLPPWWSYL